VLLMSFGALYTVLVLAIMVTVDTVALAPLLLLGPFYVTQGVQARRARVEVDDRGLTVRPTRIGRTRFFPWNTIKTLRTDPPGGPRLIRLGLSTGREVELPRLDEQDRAILTSAYEVRTQ